MEKYLPLNNIWNIPFVAPIADRVDGAPSAEIITCRKDGEWEFLFASVTDMPSPYDCCQDYSFDKTVGWQPVIAPSSLVMQGYDIRNNTEYYYRRNLHIETEAFTRNLRIMLRFEGVYSNCRVWINGRYVLTHIGGFTPFEADITEAAANGTECELVIGVSDIESSDKGVWNPNGIKVSDAAWASYYAHTNVGGILRDITLFYLPADYVIGNRVTAGLTNGYRDGILKMRMLLDLSGATELKVTLKDAKGGEIYQKRESVNDEYKLEKAIYYNEYKPDFSKSKSGRRSDELYSSLYVPFKRPDVKGELYGVTSSVIIPDITAWCAETPVLYTLETTLIRDGADVCVYSEKIGFREIEYGGVNGTDSNKMYVNGKEIKLRGVCRHDISYKYGRSLTPREELQEIEAYKRNNINHVRTSHYPASKNFLRLADEYGLYVELENAVCFKGANGYPMLCAPEQILQNLSEAVEFYYNHPSVVIWSTANESGFEKSCGFRQSYEYVKEQDTTRPAIFSYPYTVSSKPLPYDIYSKHYNKVVFNLGDKKRPRLHDEFAHVACYNLADLARDNNCRLAWGESIKKGWDNIMNSNGALGCAIWSGIDEVFYIPDNISVFHQRHSMGKAVGYGEWGAVLDVYKREKPEAYLTKQAFSPVRVADCEIDETIALKLVNRFDHTNLNAVNCIVEGDNGTIIWSGKLSCDIPPRQSGTAVISADISSESDIEVSFSYGGYELQRERYVLRQKETPVVYGELSMTTDEGKVILNDGKTALAAGPYLYINGKRLESKIRRLRAENINGTQTVTVTEIFSFGRRAKYILRLSEGSLNVKLKCGLGLTAALGSNYGAAFELLSDVKSVNWIKETPYSYYPQGHLERRSGEAFAAAQEINKYGVLPELHWRDDSRNYFMESGECTTEIAVTNDFKTNRTDIIEYCVNFDNRILEISAKTAGINALTAYNSSAQFTECTSKSIIRKGSWKTVNKSNEKRCILSRKKDSTLTLAFSGTGIKIYGTRSKEQGNILVSVDGAEREKVSTRSDICDVLEFMELYSLTGLNDGLHTLNIRLCDDKGVRISGFETITAAPLASRACVVVNKGQYFRSLAWGNYFGKKLSFKERGQLRFDIRLRKNKYE